MVPSPLDSKKAGANNERLILRLLREQCTLSQKQLCQKTKLNSSTVSTIVARLREKDLICETQGTSVSRGPKPVLLTINPQGRFLVGAELNPAYIRIGLFNFHMELVDQTEARLPAKNVEDVVECLTVSVLGLLTKNQVKSDIVLGLGVTISGSVSADGTVELSSTLGWQQVPLGPLLSSHLSFPVQIFTTRVRLLAEISLDPGLGQAAHSILYLNVADGVGANAIIDDHLIHGASNRAGEIGHIIVDTDGPPCGCGHKGCLETLISGPALAKRIQQDLAQGESSILAEQIYSHEDHRSSIYAWGNALKAGDAYALRLQNYVAEQLSRALAIAINLYDPQLLILAGYVCEQCFDALEQAIQAAVQTHVFDPTTRHLNIRPAKAGPLRYIKGAAIGVLNNDS